MSTPTRKQPPKSGARSSAASADPRRRRGGVCAGGPLHGKELVANTPRYSVPMMVKGTIGCGTYTFHDALGMWIWGYE